MSAAETLHWYENRFAEHWTEHRPAPLQLTDTEILDWMGDYCESLVYERPTKEDNGGYVLDVEGITRTHGASLREAVCVAAAKLQEENR